MTLSVHLTVSNYERSGAQGCEGGPIEKRGFAPSRLSFTGHKLCARLRVGGARQARYQFLFSGGCRGETLFPPMAVTLCLGEEHGHGDCSTSCLHSCYECSRRLPCGVDIIDDQDFTATEVFCIDMHIVLDIRRQLMVTSDMCPLAATADLYAVEAVYGSRQPA